MTFKGLVLSTTLAGAMLLGGASANAGPAFALWLDGQSSTGGNGIASSLDHAFGAGDYTLVSTADLETPGFLNSYQAVIVSRYDSNFGQSLSALAAANIAAYVGSGANQGGVAAFTNDAADDLYGAGSGDPYDPNVDALFVNAATFAAKSGHGYVGEFNGALMAFDSNDQGYAAIGLLQGDAGALGGSSGQFVYDVGPVGDGNPIDKGVSFPFTDQEDSTYLTIVKGADPNQVVDVYSNGSLQGVPAVVANGYVITGGEPSGAPEPSTWALLMAGVGALGMVLRRARSVGVNRQCAA